MRLGLLHYPEIRGLSPLLADDLQQLVVALQRYPPAFDTTGTTTGFTAGAGAAVLVDSTFTGGLGTTAYSLGDIVLALKRAKILAE